MQEDLEILDKEILEQLLDLDDGHLGLIQEMHGLFQEDTPPRLTLMEKALAEKNAEVFSELAHALKGAASTMGALRMRKAAHIAEEKARLDQPLDAGLIEAIEKAYDEAHKALSDFIAEKSA